MHNQSPQSGDQGGHANKRKKTRLVAKKGSLQVLLFVANIPVIYLDNRTVFAIDNHGERYMMVKNLSEIFESLDPKQFFRANRRMIIHIEYIKSFRVNKKMQIEVVMNERYIDEAIIISQETATAFRKWIAGE